MPTFKPPAPPFIGARFKGGRQTPRAIVMHGTVSSDNPGTARNIAKWWQGTTSPKSSCHYVVDPREVIQCVGDHTVAFHCGHNTGSIGVELCDEQAGPASRWSDADSQAIIKRAARLVAELCLAYGISPSRPSVASLKRKGPHGIYGHNDSRLAFGKTSHTDPRDFPWAQFLRLVKVEIAAIKKGAKVKPPKPKSRLRGMQWNVGVTQRPDEVIETINEAIVGHRPDVFALQEAYRLPGAYKGLPKGWQVVTGLGVGSERYDCALLVRPGIKIERRDKQQMKRRWKGPLAGKWHDARVNYGVILRKEDGSVWKPGVGHGPFGAGPVAEFVAAGLRWLRMTLPGRPVIFFADLNLREAEARRRIAAPAKADLRGRGVDFALWRNCRLADFDVYGEYGSKGHPIQRFDFEA